MPHAWLRDRCRISCLVVFLLGMGAWMAPMWSAAQIAEGEASRGAPYRTVKGTLIRIEGRYYVIKDDNGKEMHLLVSPDTIAEGSFKTGDRIEVAASPIEHAMFIKPLSLRRLEVDLEAATRTIRGRLLRIEGKYYVLKDAKGLEFRLLVTAGTEMAGNFRPGDDLEVAISPVEHAMSIRSTP